MEVYSSSVEDQLIDGLSFKLSAGSSYITDRKMVTFSHLVVMSIPQLVELVF